MLFLCIFTYVDVFMHGGQFLLSISTVEMHNQLNLSVDHNADSNTLLLGLERG